MVAFTEAVKDFEKYCKSHPEERFLEALRNWASVLFSEAGPSVDIVDNPPIETGKRRVDKNNRFLSYSLNGVPYKQEDGYWVRDEDLLRRRGEQDQHCRDLVFALQSRPLTDEEMQEVAELDYHLLSRGSPYNETELRKQFGEMLLLQFKLKLAAGQSKVSTES